jgi:hypothetical protein
MAQKGRLTNIDQPEHPLFNLNISFYKKKPSSKTGFFNKKLDFLFAVISQFNSS